MKSFPRCLLNRVSVAFLKLKYVFRNSVDIMETADHLRLRSWQARLRSG
jgi:hypothetical protein